MMPRENHKVQTLQTVRPVVSGVVVQALAVVDIALSLSGATWHVAKIYNINHVNFVPNHLCHGNQGMDT